MKTKLFVLLLLSAALGMAGRLFLGLDLGQAGIIGIFSMSIIGTLFFWDFRLSFVFIGSAVLLIMRAVDMETFIRYASLDVILFLISMMIIVGMMKDAGFFAWLLTLVLRVRRLTGTKMVLILMSLSAVFSGLMGEVASIIVMTLVILDISDFLEVNPAPLVIVSVLATNIGSAATVFGNPVGVLIAARGGLTFEDFLVHALPLSTVVLLATMGIVLLWYRHYIRELSVRLNLFQDDKSFLQLISIPPDRRTRISIGIFLATIICVALHKRLEIFLGLVENTLLITIPVLSAGIVMLYRHDRARHYIEKEVEWPSLLFFMFLFAQAGVIQASGIAGHVAGKLIEITGYSPKVLTGTVLFASGMLSSGLDNVVTVASFVPVVQSLDLMSLELRHLWWALLFGACYGGNMTMIGSTANIVALGLLEKNGNIRINAFSWIKIGLIVGMVSMSIACLALFYAPFLF